MFGTIMIWEVWRYVTKNRIPRYYIQPDFLFSYDGFGWIQPLPGNGMYWVFYGLAVLAFLITIGLLYRPAMIAFFFVFTYIFLLDQTHYLNHFYLISLLGFILIFLPLHRDFSVDARLHPHLRTKVTPNWTLLILRLHIAIPYIYGGFAKLNGDWLQGEPMRHWILRLNEYPILNAYITHPTAAYFFSYGGLLLDLFIVPIILWRRTRWLGLSVAIFFHLMNAWIFSIGVFPWMMIGATLIFLPPEWFRFWQKNNEPSKNTPMVINRQQIILLSLLSLYLVFQLLFPFRYLLYPGNPNWSEEGHRWSWHMKLRSKDGWARFILTDRDSQQAWEINPQDVINRSQHDEMSGRPIMIVAFAHYLKAAMQEQGYENIEVRAWVMASMNYRAPQLLIDPTVDLTTVRNTLAPADWILPLHQPLKGVSNHTIMLTRNDLGLVIANLTNASFPLDRLRIIDENGFTIELSTYPVPLLEAEMCVILYETWSDEMVINRCGFRNLPIQAPLPDGHYRVEFDGETITECASNRCIVSLTADQVRQAINTASISVE